MPTIRDRIRSRLAGNPGFVAVATGGVWTQPLVPPQRDPTLPDNPGQTEAPFDDRNVLVKNSSREQCVHDSSRLVVPDVMGLVIFTAARRKQRPDVGRGLVCFRTVRVEVDAWHARNSMRPG